MLEEKAYGLFADFYPMWRTRLTDCLRMFTGCRGRGLLIVYGFLSPDPNWFRSRGVDPTFLIMYEHKGGVNPLTFCQKCMGTGGGVTFQNEACMSARCWKCIIGRGIEPENVCFVGGTTDKSQWIHKLF